MLLEATDFQIKKKNNLWQQIKETFSATLENPKCWELKLSTAFRRLLCHTTSTYNEHDFLFPLLKIKHFRLFLLCTRFTGISCADFLTLCWSSTFLLPLTHPSQAFIHTEMFKAEDLQYHSEYFWGPDPALPWWKIYSTSLPQFMNYQLKRSCCLHQVFYNSERFCCRLT